MPIDVFYPNDPRDWPCHLSHNGAALCGTRLAPEAWTISTIGGIVDDALCPKCAALRSPESRIQERHGLHNTSVYLINIVGTALYKIGISSDVQRRLATLQCNNPMPLRLVWEIGRFLREDALDIERTLHQHYHDYRAGVGGQREWFRLHPSEPGRIMQYIEDWTE